MKKNLKLLLLIVVPLLFVACSDDEYKDLQIPGKSIEATVKVRGCVYNEDGTWYLDTDLRKIIYTYVNFGDEEGAVIRVNSHPSNIDLASIAGVEKTFTVKFTLYNIEHDGPLAMIYYYVADIYEIE